MDDSTSFNLVDFFVEHKIMLGVVGGSGLLIIGAISACMWYQEQQGKRWIREAIREHRAEVRKDREQKEKTSDQDQLNDDERNFGSQDNVSSKED